MQADVRYERGADFLFMSSSFFTAPNISSLLSALLESNSAYQK